MHTTTTLPRLPARVCIALVGIAASLLLPGCAGRVDRAEEIAAGGSLPPCPATPNCVSSSAAQGAQGIKPLSYGAGNEEAEAAWSALIATLEAMPRMTIVTRTPTYLHAEARSAIFRFVDDLEFQLQPESRVIAIRSASRLGISDLGVNRRRMEQIRSEFERRLSAGKTASAP